MSERKTFNEFELCSNCATVGGSRRRRVEVDAGGVAIKATKMTNFQQLRSLYSCSVA